MDGDRHGCLCARLGPMRTIRILTPLIGEFSASSMRNTQLSLAEGLKRGPIEHTQALIQFCRCSI